MELTPLVTLGQGEVELAAAVTWLPPGREVPAGAVARRVLDQERADDLGYREVAVTPDLAGPQLAARAAAGTLADAGAPGGDVDLLLHAHSHYQGHDFFSPAHFVANEVGASRAVAVGVEQMCNGAAAAMGLAVPQVRAAGSTALLTTGDSFRAPGFDRWGSDYGMVYGDGGTAVLLRPATGGWPLLRSVASIGVPALERTHRGFRRFAPAARWSTPGVDVRATKRSFLRDWDGEPIGRIEADAVGTVLTAALDAAEVRPADVRAVVLPRLGADTLAAGYAPVVAARTEAELLDPGRDTGHLGAGDVVAGLSALAEAKTLAAGESAVLLSVGAGFTWSAVVVEAV